MTNLIHKPNLDPELLLIFLITIRNQVDHFLKVLSLAGINPIIKSVTCILLFFLFYVYTQYLTRFTNP